MPATRRQLLKGLTMGTGATLLNPMIQRVTASVEGIKASPRFVFVLQSNGFDAIQACPETIPFQQYGDREKFETINLTNHGLAPLLLADSFSPREKSSNPHQLIQTSISTGKRFHWPQGSGRAATIFIHQTDRFCIIFIRSKMAMTPTYITGVIIPNGANSTDVRWFACTLF